MSISLTDFYELLKNPNAPLTVSGLSVVADSDDKDPRHPAAVPVNRVYHEPVRITHVEFDCYVDLSNCVFHQTLVIEHCHFKQGLKLADVQVKGRLSLKESTFDDPKGRWLDFRRMRVDGLLDATNVIAEVCINLENLRTGDDVWFHGIQARNALHSDEDLAAAQAHWTERTDQSTCTDVRGKALNFDGAEIGKHCYFIAQGGRKVEIKGQIDLRAKVKGQVTFAQATVLSEVGQLAIDMETAEVGGSVFFRDKTHITGQIDLRAKVAGFVDFNQATVLSEVGQLAINMDAAEVGGSVFFRDNTRITGQIDLRAKVAGTVHFMQATVLNKVGQIAIQMYAAEVGVSVFFRGNTYITGQIDLRAKVARTVEFLQATVLNVVGQLAINMETAEVGGAVFFRDKTHITGQIDLRAKVKGLVELSQTTVLNGTVLAIRMDEFEGGEVVFLRDGTFIQGDVRMMHATLHAGLLTSRELDRSKYEPATEGTPKPFTITGALDLKYAKIHGPMHLGYASIGGGVNLEQADIDGHLDLCGGALGHSQETQADRYVALLASDKVEDKERPKAFTRWTNEQDLYRIPFPPNADLPPELKKPPALNLRMAKVHGRVWLKGQTILGTVDAEDAEIDGEANFTKCKVHGDLILRSATVKGRVFSDEQEGGAEPYPQVRDTVDLQGARLADVNINLKNCKGAVLPKEIRLDDAEIGCLKLSGSLPQGDRRFKVQNLRFRDMDVGGLKVKGDSKGIGNFLWRYWRDALRAYIWVGLISCFFYLGLEGNPVVEWPIVWVGAAYAFLAALVWGIQTFGKPDTTYAAGKLLDFLLHGTRFSRAFYVEVERWKRAQGDDATADEVFLSRRRRELVGEKDSEGKTVHAAADWVTWGVRWLADFSMGYGVRVRRLIHLYVLSWLITWAVFANPASVERPLDFEAVRPAAPIAATETGVNPWDDEGGQAEDWEWSPQEAFFMAMRLHVPLVQLMVEENWTPADRAMEIRGLARVQYDSFAGLVQAMNLILLPLILAGATGFLKRNS